MFEHMMDLSERSSGKVSSSHYIESNFQLISGTTAHIDVITKDPTSNYYY